VILAVSNQKGGCGKTTTAINLSSALAAMGKRTLLIDLDPQTHASYGLGIRTDRLEQTVYNVLTERADKKQFLESVIHPYASNLDIAPGHVLLSTIEQEFADRDHAVAKLKDALDHMVFPYEYVVIDCPPSLGFLTFNALFAADLVIVPVDLGSFSLIGVGKLLSMIELIRVKMDRAPKVYALPTLVDLRSLFAKRMIEQVRQAFCENIFSNFIHASIACREAQALGVPLRNHKPDVKAAQDYDKLAIEIVSVFGRVAEPEPERAILPGAGEPRRSRVKDFMLQAPAAAGVYIVGDFNGWRIDAESKLWNSGKGLWQKRLALPPGRYRYKFVIDGAWTPDPSNELAEPNPYGGVDSILEIK